MTARLHDRSCRCWTRPLLAGLALAAATVAGAAPAHAGDYDRNDVSGRELAAWFAVLPTDRDPRKPGPCITAKTQTCQFVTLPLAFGVRGSARRHARQTYLGVEALIGVSAPPSPYDASIAIGVGATLGVETADDAYRRLRGYGELGIDVLYAGTRVNDWVTVFAEAGMRYQAIAYERPHTYLHIGARITNNFVHFGGHLSAGVGWTFD